MALDAWPAPDLAVLRGVAPTSSQRGWSLEKTPRARRLRALAATEKAGQVDHATAERYRRDLAAVGDDFH
jgi:hypothetical protein